MFRAYRTFEVQINNKFSNKQSIVAGVPQGSILGPILFLFYINDIPKHNDTQLAFFADDTAIISNSWNKNEAIQYLQRHLDLLEKYYSDCKIKINVQKTEL